MIRLSTADKKKAASLIETKQRLYSKIKSLRSIKHKTDDDYKNIIKACKSLSKCITDLHNYGYKTASWSKLADAEYWTSQYKKTQSKTTPADGKKTQSKTAPSDKSLYYIMLCWTIKDDYYICDNVINDIKGYFEKLGASVGIEFMDCMTSEFPGRTEYTSTYKITTTKETYDTIIASAQYMIDITSSNMYEACNIGVFGKKIS